MKALDELVEMPELEMLRDNATKASEFLRGMANESRLLILCRLAEKETSVSELETHLGLSQSALSQHLAVLRRLGLVEQRRQSRVHYYMLANDGAKKIMGVLYEMYCMPNNCGVLPNKLKP